MDRVQVTRPFVGICHMQVCAVKDPTDSPSASASWASGERKFWLRATARTRLERGMFRRCTWIMKVERHRLHCVEQWADSPYKEAVLTRDWKNTALRPGLRLGTRAGLHWRFE